MMPGTGASESSSWARLRPRAADSDSASAAPAVVAVGPAGKGDARPLHAQRAGVGLAVGRIVECGEDVVEKVFDVCV